MKRFMISAAAVLLCFGCITGVSRRLCFSFAPVGQYIDSAPPVLILDAGHGGEDGGAVSLNGIPESRINLAIVEKMDDILGLYGEAPMLLRSEDVSLHDPDAKTLRQKKASDLRNRAAAIQSVRQAALVSIHQNIYPNPGVRGLQAFYAPTDGSEQLARLIQESVQRTLQQDNHRPPKRISESVYLMNHISCPAVLVECGFLSNPEEAQLLQTADYQRRLAAVLSSVWLAARSL